MSVNLINTLSQPVKSVAKFVNYQEKANGLSGSRFVQDTATNLVPKAVFARSKADLVENSFLELSESALVYFVPAFLGEKIFRKPFSAGMSAQMKKQIATPFSELAKGKVDKRVTAAKAGLAMCALTIPIVEFSLNYIKNLLTLKAFKQGDFNNIASLYKKDEDSGIQERVEKSAKKNIARAATACALSVAGGILMAKKGADSKVLQNIGETILAPGTKFFKKNEKARKFFDKYCGLDFNGENGKLALSKGQLTSCVMIGGLGYFGAAKDRGRQNFLETLFRYPLVGFYVITGSELFEEGFKGLLKKCGKCKEVIEKNPTMEELPKLAEKLAKERKTNINAEFKRLAKQKALINSVPYLFSIGFMGFFVAGVSNLFTKYRFENSKNSS
ncbi:MAG: hypothetical protein NC390_05085 [Fusobacterium sp.]|nr:hypothetical protein [Fusobacterium sp.]